MHPSITLLTGLAAIASAVSNNAAIVQTPVGLQSDKKIVKPDYNQPPPANLSTLPAGSLFLTWRPRAHPLPPNGQIGDPCMHWPSPSTGLFHIGFLHNNGSSGATTADLVQYTDLNGGAPFIVAGGINDPIAVFDGSVIPVGINGHPTLLYTAVSFLPISWTLPYVRGSEAQALAIGAQGNRSFSFEKLKQGPVIPDPPFALNVTAFRDPFVFQSVGLDALLATSTSNPANASTWYAVISGGVHGQGPSQFLYRALDRGFQYWEYLGQWWHEPANSTWADPGNSNMWAGRWGFNFEVANVFQLDEHGYNDGPEGEFFSTLGAEWSRAPVVPQVTEHREMLWAAGNVVRRSPKVDSSEPAVTFTPTMAGKLDWGFWAYAAGGKMLPASTLASRKSGAPPRFITYLWLTGDKFGTDRDSPVAQQNWTGALLLPRELSLGTIANVVDNKLAREKRASWRVSSRRRSNDPGTVTIETLRQTIAREPLAALFNANSTRIIEKGRSISTTNSSSGVTVPFTRSPSTKFFALKASLGFNNNARTAAAGLQAGFQILSSKLEETTIYYQWANESIIVDRTRSSQASRVGNGNGIDTFVESGHLRLFDLMKNGTQVIEPLNLTIVVDNSIVEVHANDRFVLSTWIKPWYANSTQIRFFQEGHGQVVYQDVLVSEGLFNAWPGRS